MLTTTPTTRRGFLVASAALLAAAAEPKPPARIAITLDLEMSAMYPRRDLLEWNYEKGNLDEATKRYAVEAGRVVKERGGVIHYFCVGRVLEQPSVDWLKELAAAGHPIGNHTYDHVNVRATKAEDTQFRFQRAPWLVRGMTAEQVIRENIRVTTEALKQRAGVEVNGFRTPGGFHDGLDTRPDVRRLLFDLGFRWISSRYPAHAMSKPGEKPGNDIYEGIVQAQEKAQPYVYPDGLVEVPMSPVSDVGAFRTCRWKLDWFLEAIRRGVEWAIRTGGVYDFLAHPSCLVVEDPTFESVKLIADLTRKAGDRARLVGLDTIAAGIRGTKG